MSAYRAYQLLFQEDEFLTDKSTAVLKAARRAVSCIFSFPPVDKRCLKIVWDHINCCQLEVTSRDEPSRTRSKQDDLRGIFLRAAEAQVYQRNHKLQ